MQLQFSLKADSDLDRLFLFLIDNNAYLESAEAAIRAIQSGTLILLDKPKIGVEMGDGSGRREHFVPFGKGAYVLRYFFDEAEQVVRVLRIWHSREKRD